MSDARVVLVALDGFPPEAVSAELTPALWALAGRGGRAPAGGRAPLPSSTYPSFASLLTGRGPRGHGVRTTARRDGVLPDWAGDDAVAVPTLFDACRVAGRRSAFVAGDHHLHRVLRAASADERWPGTDRAPGGVTLDAHGYATNDVVLERALGRCADADVSFVFVQLNETDTLGHDLGPRHPDTLDAYRAADRAVGEIVAALEDDWDATLLVVVSDHGMRERTAAPPVWLPAASGVVDVLADGGAALVRLSGDHAGSVGDELVASRLIEGWISVSPEVLLAVAPPGRIFGASRLPAHGFHGGRDTMATLAVVGGGHPSVPSIAAAVAAASPAQADVAATIAAVLGVSLPGATGVDLAASDLAVAT